jgi:hypothetical protein
MRILDAEAKAGFPRIRGTRLHAIVPISQYLLDQWLSRLAVNVAIQERNQFSISYAGIGLTAELVGIAPDLSIVLTTPWWSRAALWAVLTWKPGLQAYLRQHDKLVYILCGEIPAVARYRYLWRYVSEVRARTEPGRLVLDIHVLIS